jgi:hypothetical protein
LGDLRKRGCSKAEIIGTILSKSGKAMYIN